MHFPIVFSLNNWLQLSDGEAQVAVGRSPGGYLLRFGGALSGDCQVGVSNACASQARCWISGVDLYSRWM